MRIVSWAALVLLGGCLTPDLSKICPHKTSITQGVFGGIFDATGAVEENVEVDLYTIVNGVQNTTVGASAETTRGGYELDVLPSMYILCAKTVCSTPVTVPTGLVELSATDATAGLTWDAPVAVPPAQMIGPCTYGD
jgi:hypothetical protein